MKSDRTQRRPNIVTVRRRGASRDRAGFDSFTPPTAIRSDGRRQRAAASHLQLGVGQSVIFDLPEEAGEIYVGDPTVANAIVRSAKRVYISGVANGQTSIFALARDGRRIAAIQVSVGRDVAELSSLLNTAIPGNEIHVRTVENTIILTGSVASAEEAQKALDIATALSMIRRRRRDHQERRSRSRAAQARSGAGAAPPAARTARPAARREK